MKCLPRSTILLAEIGLMLLLGYAPLAAAETGLASGDPVSAAIERAVRARVGRGATVTVSGVSGVRLAADSRTLVALPDPLARIGVPARFVLSDGQPRGSRARLGEATATVTVVADAVRARRTIAQGAQLDTGDVAVVPTDLKGRLLRPLPSLEDAIGARAKHDIGNDAVVTRADIVADPLVRAGDIVRAHVRIGIVEVVGDLVAAESGLKDDVVRVVNRETRHAIRARVIGRREVEVVNVR
jgi:flagella basal body P-ring formation protein FlgA